jgi:hypothetical protein
MWGLDESTCFAGFAAHSLPYLPLQARYSGPLYTCLIYMIGNERNANSFSCASTSATCLRNFVCNYASYGFLFLCHTWEIHIILNINILSLSLSHTHSFSNVLALLQLHPIASRLFSFFFFSRKRRVLVSGKLVMRFRYKYSLPNLCRFF